MATSTGGRNWFGVQLEVTQRLLDAEARRLDKLGGEVNTIHGFNSLAQKRLQSQFEELNKEYENAASRMLLGTSRQRSNPTLGIRQAGKRRPSIFDTMAKRDGSSSSSDESMEVPSSPRLRRESVSRDTDLITENGRVKSGTIDALCNRVMPKQSGGPDKLFSFTFIVSSRLFVDPYDVLVRTHDCVSDAISAGTSKVDIAKQSCRLLRDWVENAGYDFRDDRMHEPFSKLSDIIANCGTEACMSIKSIKTLLLTKIESLEQYESQLQDEYKTEKKIKQQTLARDGKMPTQSDETVMDMVNNAAELAEQLTFAEQERFGMIDASEFVETFVESEGEASKNRRKLANIAAYIEWFNRLGGLVATEICRQNAKKKRVKVLEFWIETAVACKKHQNYNSMMAIVSALNMTSVTRMKKTWSSCKSKIENEFKSLVSLMDPTGNFKNYRASIAALTETDSCVPFFSLLIKDMYFINESAEALLSNGHINFERFWPVSECLAEFLVRKQQLRSIRSEFEVQKYLRTSLVYSEAEMFKSSVENEPPSKEDHGKTMQRLKRLSGADDRKGGGDGPVMASTHAL